MAFARDVFQQNQTAWGKLPHLAVTDLHFKRSGQLDIELASGCRMPGASPCKWQRRQKHSLCAYWRGQIQWRGWWGKINRRYGYRDVFKVRFAGGVGIYPRVIHLVSDALLGVSISARHSASHRQRLCLQDERPVWSVTNETPAKTLP